ncbi:securin [Gouania willdenowi]|uniref:Securin n=1 Tax=Gouania willdenowi TaxID=441366 RepID=A0A8C5HEE2_GOUWI|nr:securin-like [Gouania willdenowi]
MSNILFADRENASLGPTLKMRQRLQSAPEILLKSPMITKKLHTPLPSGRKAFGAVNNKKISTPCVNAEEKKLLKPQEAKVKTLSTSKEEDYPEMEKFIPYDPLEFQKYSVPEDLVPLSVFALPGLACFPQTTHLCEDQLEKFDPLPMPSPVKMLGHSGGCAELDAFLHTLDELIELPLEPATDC